MSIPISADSPAYTFMSEGLDYLLTSDAHREFDWAFFKDNPGRTYRLRKALPDEVYDDISEWAYIIAHRTHTGDLHYRPLIHIHGEPDPDEFTSRWLWQMWEADNEGLNLEYGPNEVFLLEHVFRSLKPDEVEGLQPGRPTF